MTARDEMIKINKEVVFQVEWLAKRFSLGEPEYNVEDGEATVTLLKVAGLMVDSANPAEVWVFVWLDTSPQFGAGTVDDPGCHEIQAEESFDFEEKGDAALAALMQRIVACTLASWDSFDRY